MVIKQILINHICSGGFDYKENCPHKKALVMESLKRHGQLQPLIGFWISESEFMIIKGHTVLSCMIALGITEVYVNEIGPKSELECLAIRNALDESVNDIDVLKLAILLEKVRYSGGITDEEIATQLQVQLKQVLVLKDLLQLDYKIDIRKDKTQQAMNFETAHELGEK